MPIAYQILPERRLARIRASGTVSATEVMVEGAKMFADAAWVNGFSILCNYTDVTKVSGALEDIKQLAHQDTKHAPMINESQCAVVAPSDVVFGVSRMWQTLSEQSGLATRIFRNMDDALKWLGVEG